MTYFFAFFSPTESAQILEIWFLISEDMSQLDFLIAIIQLGVPVPYIVLNLPKVKLGLHEFASPVTWATLPYHLPEPLSLTITVPVLDSLCYLYNMKKLEGS